MSSVVRTQDPNGGRLLLVKGASEIILDTCSHYFNENGDRVTLEQEKK